MLEALQASYAIGGHEVLHGAMFRSQRTLCTGNSSYFAQSQLAASMRQQNTVGVRGRTSQLERTTQV